MCTNLVLLRESDTIIDQTTLEAKIRRGIEEYEQDRFTLVSSRFALNCTVPSRIALFLVERYRKRGYKSIYMNRSYKYSLFLVLTVCKICTLKVKMPLLLLIVFIIMKLHPFSCQPLKCKWYITLMG